MEVSLLSLLAFVLGWLGIVVVSLALLEQFFNVEVSIFSCAFFAVRFEQAEFVTFAARKKETN